jgi:alpha-beta hydrolase superfamily lysophospholipase
VSTTQLIAADGTRLAYYEWPVENAALAVMLVHGFAEHCGRYSALAEQFNARGIAVAGVDLRGHGLSSGRRGHVDRFSDYHLDLDRIHAHMCQRYPALPLCVLAHSMGCLVVADWTLAQAARATLAIDGQGVAIPLTFAFSSPMIALAESRRLPPQGLVRMLSWAVPWLPLPVAMRGDDVCRDPERARAYDIDPLIVQRVSVRWVAESLGAGQRVLERAPKLAGAFMVAYGTSDAVVSVPAIEAFVQRLHTTHRSVCLEGAYHELLNEPEPVRLRVAEQFADWFYGESG